MNKHDLTGHQIGNALSRSQVGGSIAEAPAQITPLQGFEKRIWGEIEIVRELTHSLCAVSNRIMGNQPECAPSGGDTPEPDCEYARMDAVLNELKDVNKVLALEVARIRDGM